MCWKYQMVARLSWTGLGTAVGPRQIELWWAGATGAAADRSQGNHSVPQSAPTKREKLWKFVSSYIHPYIFYLLGNLMVRQALWHTVEPPLPLWQSPWPYLTLWVPPEFILCFKCLLGTKCGTILETSFISKLYGSPWSHLFPFVHCLGLF